MDRPQDRRALIEVLDRDGRVRHYVEVWEWPVTLGRALECDVVVDDPHVAPVHARLVPDGDGTVMVHAGATRNGVQVERRTLMEGESLPVPRDGSALQLGATRVRVRLPGDLLEAEKPLGLAGSGASAWVTLACALALWALALSEYGVELDPGSRFTDWLLPLLGVPGVLVLWCLLWGIGSKLFQHRFEFLAHFAVVVKGLLVAVLIDLLLPVIAFSLSWDWLSRVAPTVAAAAAAATLYAHAALVVPVNKRVLAATIGGCFALGMGVLAALNYQRTDRLFAEPYTATLAPPAFRLAPAVAPKQFLDEATA
ncbi:MAG TPA: FHA domain-containing protein, partial [Burkholderiaceae bacterium]|nr:FHA domain-containing protein [Burkholderiaceae bacterium]